MKINYKETEDIRRGMGHGVEFHYSPVADDIEKLDVSKPVAFLVGYDWFYGKPKSITILIRPVSSPWLKDLGKPPERIITEVKKAIGIFLENPSLWSDQSKLIEHVRTWLNA
jgi:hypothetical protein